MILKFFHYAYLLTTKDRRYRQRVAELFRFLIKNDQVDKDRTSQFFPVKKMRACVIPASNTMIAGLEEVGFILKDYPQLSFEPKVADGTRVKSGQMIASISGDNRIILSLERTVLNILQRMSGIATETNRMVQLVHPRFPPPLFVFSRRHPGSPTNNSPFIAATRKTPWGLLDKKAVVVGGGLSHRLSLADGILIKDNHLSLWDDQKVPSFLDSHQPRLESLLKATTAKAKNLNPKDEAEAVKWALKIILTKVTKTLVEIEVTTSNQALAAISTFCQLETNNYLAIMFDNWQIKEVKKAVASLTARYDTRRIVFEASGGINKDNIKQWAETKVDILSLGSLTHSTTAANLSLEFI